MKPPVSFSLGLGLTTECDLACAHCYRPTERVYRLTYDQVVSVCDHLPLRSVNLGTGENGLHPEFRHILGFLLDRGYKVSITSNGYTLAVLSDDELRSLNDVELSLDFPTESEQDAFRAQGNWRRVMRSLERCHRLGVQTTIVTVLMKINYRRMGELARWAACCEANLRVNVYQPVRSDAYVLAYDEFWEGFQRLFGEAQLVACTEPVVSAALGLNGQSSCGRTTVRVSPQGDVLPCVYWPSPQLTIAELVRLGRDVVESEDFRRLRALPALCNECKRAATCAGGCGSRRALVGRPREPDPYCPHRFPTQAQLTGTVGALRDLPKASSACTTIVRGA